MSTSKEQEVTHDAEVGTAPQAVESERTDTDRLNYLMMRLGVGHNVFVATRRQVDDLMDADGARPTAS